MTVHEGALEELLTRWREPFKGKPGVTEVFLAALGVHGKDGWQCELGFGDGTTRSFQSDACLGLDWAIEQAHTWAKEHYR